jgi:hypothetical protein
MLLSGAVLSVTPALIAAPRDRLADLTPLVPTTNRYFNRKEDLVSAFVRIYQHGKGDPKPVVMASRVTDSKGVVVVNRVEHDPPGGVQQSRPLVRFPVYGSNRQP